MVASVTEIVCPIPPWPYAPAQGIVSLYDGGKIVTFSGTVAQQQLSLTGWCKRARQIVFVALMRFVGDASTSEFEIKVNGGSGVLVRQGDLNTTASAGNLGTALQGSLPGESSSSFVVEVCLLVGGGGRERERERDSLTAVSIAQPAFAPLLLPGPKSWRRVPPQLRLVRGNLLGNVLRG